jgi:ribokinase
VVVLGSANIDLVYSVEEVPALGQTVLASGQARHPGGKGLNQAVAAARAGARTAFIGAVGDDPGGVELVAVLRDCGIDTTLLRTVEEATGTALITVQRDGNNTIVVAAGANGTINELTVAAREAVTAASVLVAQLEVPLAVVAQAAEAARSAGTTVVLNAAPATPLDDALLTLVDVLVVNENEAMTLAGTLAGGDDPIVAAGALTDRASTVVVTLGSAGAAVLQRGEQIEELPAIEVQAADTTGAGDTFTGVLAAGLAAGEPVTAAARRAVIAAGISVERHGAVPSIPTRAEIDARRVRLNTTPPGRSPSRSDN